MSCSKIGKQVNLVTCWPVRIENLALNPPTRFWGVRTVDPQYSIASLRSMLRTYCLEAVASANGHATIREPLEAKECALIDTVLIHTGLREIHRFYANA